MAEHVMPFEELASQGLSLEVGLDGHDGCRWMVKIGVCPAPGSGELDGLTVVLLDKDEAPWGPAVVVPLAGRITESKVFRVPIRGPRLLGKGSILRCTVFFADGETVPCMVERCLPDMNGREPPTPPLGLPTEDGGCDPAGLTDEDVKKLKEEFPDILAHPDDEDEAFRIFEEDFTDFHGLDDDDLVTQEILRLIRG